LLSASRHRAARESEIDFALRVRAAKNVHPYQTALEKSSRRRAARRKPDREEALTDNNANQKSLIILLMPGTQLESFHP